MRLSIEEILIATGAQVLKNEAKNDLKLSFSTDTRTIKSGEIYLPLKGANFDGEKFIDKALEMGAVGYFCTEETLFDKAGIVFLVKDTLTTYLQLANFYKKKINPKTVAITGSSGKTTTKEMAFCVAKEKFKTHKSELNFNNEIGLCKTILSMPEDTEVLILEMGMRGLGEIELLSKYSEPDITIIANVGTAHIGRLGSRENIAKAKCEITKFQKEGGTLIAHDDELIKKTVQCSTSALQEIYFSLSDAKITEKRVGYSKFTYRNDEYELNIEGDYNVQNSLATIEMGLKLGMTPEEIKSGLKKYSPIEKRWEMEKINSNGKKLNLINDSYNANPESVKAALETFLSLYSPPLAVVLGDMGELGEKEAQYHSEIGDFLAKKITDLKNVKIITVGKLANEIAVKLNSNGILAVNLNDNAAAARYILDNMENSTTIILKASRSMKFEEILNELKQSNNKTI